MACWVFISVRGLSLVAASGGHSSSRCPGLSLSRPPDAQAQQLWLTGPAAPRHVGSSQTRARTRVPCIGRQTLNHCATREAPHHLNVGLYLHFIEGSVESQAYRASLGSHRWLDEARIKPDLLLQASLPCTFSSIQGVTSPSCRECKLPRNHQQCQNPQPSNSQAQNRTRLPVT